MRQPQLFGGHELLQAALRGVEQEDEAGRSGGWHMVLNLFRMRNISAR
jgi:hypothetical protein